MTMHKKTWLERMKGNWDLLLFCLPGIVVTVIYHYIPIYGIQIGFKNYKIASGIVGSTWTGLENFRRFFSGAYAWLTIKNTLILSAYSMVSGFPMAVILALLLNSFRHKKYRKVIQAVTYAPHFISTVVMCGMIILFLSPRVGVINTVLAAMGNERINFMSKSEYWRHIYVWTGVWQGMGWSSVIYFAALAGVSPEYHEAAIVDGANMWQRVIHVDIPGILPTAIILLIMACGKVLTIGYEKVLLLQNLENMSTSDIISTYVYRIGLSEGMQYSFSTAVGLFQSVVSLLLLTVVNWISRRVSETSLW